MHRPTTWSRIALTSSALALCALACDSVLDIEEPTRRTEAGAGAGGEPDVNGNGGTPSAGGTSSGGGGSANAGEAGMAPGGDGPGGIGGDGGSGGDPQFVPEGCEPTELRCGGDAEMTPQVCDDTGHWVQNSDEAEADCPLLCAGGRCVECAEDKKRCSACEEGDASCNPNQPQKCVDGTWKNDGATCDSRCDGGGCVAAPSCDPSAKAETTCGADSCCASLPVVGGPFKRDFDGQDFYDDSFPATISSFFLDKYEVTVGRMRQFANAYNQLSLKEGQGKSGYVPNDGGWSTSFPLPKDRDELISQLKCDGGTWSDTPATSSDNNLPINCVPFAVAYAFCIWDGGRLPTEAEWNYAAAGGSEQRVYPWKAPESGPAITDAYANYTSLDNPDAVPTAVGSKSPGAGRWGQLDLAGNVAEWTLDYSASYPEECSDCLNSTPSAGRAYRGGSYLSDEFTTVVSVRSDLDPTAQRSFLGFRCARERN